jgi:hypothetical protein
MGHIWGNALCATVSDLFKERQRNGSHTETFSKEKELSRGLLYERLQENMELILQIYLKWNEALSSLIGNCCLTLVGLTFVS